MGCHKSYSLETQSGRRTMAPLAQGATHKLTLEEAMAGSDKSGRLGLPTPSHPPNTQSSLSTRRVTLDPVDGLSGRRAACGGVARPRISEGRVFDLPTHCI
jgi:hypothetical protein